MADPPIQAKALLWMLPSTMAVVAVLYTEHGIKLTLDFSHSLSSTLQIFKYCDLMENRVYISLC